MSLPSKLLLGTSASYLSNERGKEEICRASVDKCTMKTVSARYFASYRKNCLALGISAETLDVHLPGGGALLEREQARVPADALIAMLQSAERTSGRFDIGLYCGKNFRPEIFLDAGHLFLCSATAREALTRYLRYQPLTQQIGRMSLVEDGGENAWLVWDCGGGDPERFRIVSEAVFTAYAAIGTWLLWNTFEGNVEVHFQHRDIGQGPLVSDFFAAPVAFGQPQSMIRFGARKLDAAMPQPNPAFAELLLRRLDDRLARLDRQPTLSDEVGEIIEQRLRNGGTQIASVARALDLSERTLRRRLNEEGTSFRDLLERVRRNTCTLLLRDGGMSLAEISEALGYSEQSAFNRAFRGWYGVAPRQMSDTAEGE